ncbi:MAG: hypothetical protein ABR972_05260 [Acidimicrobiales bacterium]
MLDGHERDRRQAMRDAKTIVRDARERVARRQPIAAALDPGGHPG